MKIEDVMTRVPAPPGEDTAPRFRLMASFSIQKSCTKDLLHTATTMCRYQVLSAQGSIGPALSGHPVSWGNR